MLPRNKIHHGNFRQQLAPAGRHRYSGPGRVAPRNAAADMGSWDRTAVWLIVTSSLLALVALGTELDYLVAGAALATGAAAVLISLPILLGFVDYFRVLRLFAASTMFGYGGGTAISWVFSFSEEVGGFSMVLASFNVSCGDVALTILAANIFGSLLLLLSCKQTMNRPERIFAQQVAVASAAPSARRHLYPLAFLLFLLQVYALVSGRVGYKGYASSAQIEPITMLLVTVAPLSAFITGVLLARIRAGIDSGWTVLLMPTLALLNLIWFFSLGRTVLLSISICCLLGFSAVKALSLRRVFLSVLIVGLPLMTIAYVLTQNIRQFSWADETARENVFKVLQHSLTQTSQLTREERQDTTANQRGHLAYRPFVANFPAQLIARWRDNGVSVVAFEEVINGIRMTVPRLILVDKSDLLTGEELYHQRLGMPPDDNAESMLMSSLAAFSILGPPIFALLAWLYIRVMVVAFSFSRSAGAILLGAVTLAWLGLSGGELAMVSYFATARNALIVAALLWAFEKFYLAKNSVA